MSSELSDFLKETEAKLGEFRSVPQYNPITDTFTVYTADEPSYEKVVTDKLTLFLSIKDNRRIGYEVTNLRGILDNIVLSKVGA